MYFMCSVFFLSPYGKIYWVLIEPSDPEVVNVVSTPAHLMDGLVPLECFDSLSRAQYNRLSLLQSFTSLLATDFQ
jgi:hypothetical protein